LVVGDRWASWTGKFGDARLHRHFAAQAVISVNPVVVETIKASPFEGRFILIDPLVPHRLLPGGEATIFFVEPCRLVDEALLTAWTAATRQAGEEPVHIADSPSFWREAWSRQEADVVDARLAQALATIDTRLPHGRVDLAAVSAPLGLSTERFRHVFAAAVGLPFSRYVPWRRVRLAVLALDGGDDATTAAHAAGFADLPHFARTLRALFGISAGDGLIRR
jgi:AraC-like DNA-binding protein